MTGTDDPKYLKLAGGRVVNGATGETSVDTSGNKLYTTPELGKKAKPTFDYGTRRYLDDLRMPPNASRPYAIILSYSLFGLSDADIAHILHTSPDAISEYKASKEYTHLLDGVLQNVREHDKDKVRKILNREAENAANAIAMIAKDKLHKQQFNAAKDILDRTGHRVDDSEGDKKQGGIVIRILDDRDKKTPIEVGDL